jgi:hypothetical protein
MSGPVAVFLDRGDAASAPSAAGEGLWLTPAARADRAVHGTAKASAPRFTCWDHARCVVSAQRALKEFDEAARSCELPISARVLGRQVAWQLAAITERLNRTLPSGECEIRTKAGWRRTTSKGEAVELLLGRILDWGLQHRSDAKPPPMPALFRRLVRWHGASLGRQAGWVVAPHGKLKLDLDEHVRHAHTGVASARMTRGGWADYLQLARSIRHRRAEVAIVPADEADLRLRECVGSFVGIGQSFSDPLLRMAWTSYGPYFRRHLASLVGVLQEAPQLMRLLRAPLAICYEANGWLAAGLLDAARSSGRRAAVVNHNSHAPTGSAIADAVLGFLFEQRTANPVVELSGQWSPNWKQWRAAGIGAARVDFLPYRYAYPGGRVASKRFRILHAGNYQNWSDFIPWIAETSDEYVDGIAAFADAMVQLHDLELVIRVRAKPEVNADLVRQLVPASANIRVCGTEQDFLEQLSECDLLVSHFSTTVEQALQMGKPVLLWGSTGRFCQFPPSWERPTFERRAPVYAVRRASELPAMLRAIAAAHVQRPLDDEEVAGFRNSPLDPLLSDLAARLLTA